MKRRIKISLLKKDSTIKKFIKKEYHPKIEKIDNYFIVFNQFESKIENKLIQSFINDKGEIFTSKQSMLIWKIISLNEEERFLIISIGDTRRICNDWELEKFFGIKIGLNSIKDKKRKIREITWKNKATGDNFKEGKNLLTGLSNFNFKANISTLKMMKIEGEFEKTKTIFHLNDWFSTPIDETQDKSYIFATIERFIKNHYNNSYKEQGYGFLDNYSSVSKELASTLLEELFDKINNEEFTGIFVWPKFEGEHHHHFTIGNSEKKLFILENEEVLKILKKQKQKITNTKIRSWNESNLLEEEIPISKCIFFEYLRQDKTYIYSDGEWTEIEKNFLSKVYKEYRGLSTYIFDSGNEFIEWNQDLYEKGYNKKLSKTNGWLLLDRKLFNLSKVDKLELGDLAISKDSIIIAVKNIHNSTSMSHLSYQVKHAIELIKSKDTKVEKQMQEHIKKIEDNDFEIDPNYKFQVSKIKEYVVAIASKRKFENLNLPEIPFFAKQTLISLVEDPPHKFDIKIVWIKISSKNTS